jgi:uncharacterized protein DUF6790
MYVVFVVLLLLVLPAGCVAAEALWRHGAADIVLLIGKWFVFWAVGARLFIAGVRQVVQPQFTAESIFDSKDEASSAIVWEIGFANLAMGVLGLLTLVRPGWLLPAAIVGGLFYGLAGLGQAARGKRNSKEQTALVSDLLMFVLLGAFVAIRGF